MPAEDRRLVPEWLLYVIVTVATVLALVWGLQLWRTDLSVPFNYTGDALANGAIVKGEIEHGWYLVNEAVGLPGRLDMRSFPQPEDVHYGAEKLISFVARAWAPTVNVYYLLTYLLAALAATWALRLLRVSQLAAAAAALLYAFQPYHLFRSEAHLALSAYFAVPLACAFALLLMRDAPLLFADDGRGPLRATRLGVGALLTCVLLGSTGIYYAFFACFFFLLAGAYSALRAGEWRRLATAGVLVALTVLVVLVNVSPTIVAKFTGASGPTIAGSRSPGEAEVVGLKIDQLVLPVDGHRLAPLAKLKALYHAGLRQLTPTLDNEAVFSSLGAVGAIGFVVLLLLGLIAFARPPSSADGRTLADAGWLSLGGVLLATVGGFGAMVAVLLPQIRAYNRISIFLAFFALLAVAVGVDRLAARLAPTRAALLGGVFAVLLVVVGLLDQVSPAFVPAYAQTKATWRADAAFVAEVESGLPANAAVFQAPYMAFPEPGGPFFQMQDYDHFRGYLHSSRLRWSYGAMKGTEADTWQRETASLPPVQMAAKAKAAGFSALWIDLGGYQDAAQVRQQFDDALGRPIAIDATGRRVVYRF